MKTYIQLFLLCISVLLTTQINISILKGEKLFNNFTPIVLNLDTPDTMEKKSSVDLICVIDVSGSMRGPKINQVKGSLKTLISMMDPTDRIGLVLLSSI